MEPDLEWLREVHPDVSAPVGPHFTIDDDDWRASIERVVVSPALHVYLTQAEVRRDLRIEPRASRTDPFLASQIVIAGRADMELDDGVRPRARRGTGLLFRMREPRSVYVLKGGTRLVMAGYSLATGRVARLLGGEVPAALAPLLERAPGEVRCLSHPASRTMHALAASLFTPGLNGPLRRLMMEGEVLSLLALQANAIARQPLLPRRAPPALSRRERDAAREARRLLLADMRSPPSLDELADAVGLDEKRLNSAFRRLFGTTVFGLLRTERLEHARIALEKGAVSLKQAAYAVGYNHVTNFISAFRGRYGSPPVQYLGAEAKRPARRRKRR
jgi:AraC-like DNA-binding protein